MEHNINYKKLYELAIIEKEKLMIDYQEKLDIIKEQRKEIEVLKRRIELCYGTVRIYANT